MLKLINQFLYLFETGMIAMFSIYGVAKIAHVIRVLQKDIYMEKAL